MAMELCIDLAVGVTGESARAYVDSLAFRRPFQRVDEHSAGVPALAGAELDQVVRNALPSLTANEASAIWLVDVCKASYADAAQSMRCSTRAIERHVVSGRRRIRNAIIVG